MSRTAFDPAFEDLPKVLPIFPLEGVLLLPGGRLPLIGVGGLASGADAYAKIRAGASDYDLDQVMISAVPEGANAGTAGRMLVDVADDAGEDPTDTLFRLLADERDRVQMVIFGMGEDDVRTVMAHPQVAVASDGWTLDPDAGGAPHPRSYGTYVRVLGEYVREQGVLDLEEAVRKMTSLPAARLRRDDRGGIRPGARADLVAFDPGRVADRATFDDGEAWGNFPQTYSHVGLIIAAMRLSRPWRDAA